MSGRKGRKMSRVDAISRQSVIDALTGMAVPRYRDPECVNMWERDRTINRAIEVMLKKYTEDLFDVLGKGKDAL